MRADHRGAVALAAAVGLLAVLGGMGRAVAAPDQVSITVATGPVGGLYHPVGGAICTLVNENRDTHGITCTIDITRGSVGNIRDLRDGDVDLAMAQSDWQHDAFRGTGPFTEEGPFDDLRSVFAIYVEHFTVVARNDKDIDSFVDLKGKRVHMGQPGSGRRYTMGVLMEAYGWADEEVIDVSEFAAPNQAVALCDNEFDAFVQSIGHPNSSTKDATAVCDAKLVPVSGPIIEKIAGRDPYYVISMIPAETYSEQYRDVSTLGLVATLVSSTKVKPEVIYQVTKAFFENLDSLRELSPLFSSLTDEEMVTTGLTAPIHEGALRYFSEAGLE
jgi:uncharacterized protein